MTRHHPRPDHEVLKEHRRQHNNRWASLVQDPDGSWRLSAYFGYDTGKRVSLAFEQMVRTYRNGADRTGPLSGSRRAAAPTSTTCACCAHAATTWSTTTDGNSTSTTGRTLCGLRTNSNPASVRRYARRGNATPSCEPDRPAPRATLAALADVAESGRRAGFRSQYPQGCGGSNPPVRTEFASLVLGSLNLTGFHAG